MCLVFSLLFFFLVHFYLSLEFLHFFPLPLFPSEYAGAAAASIRIWMNTAGRNLPRQIRMGQFSRFGRLQPTDIRRPSRFGCRRMGMPGISFWMNLGISTISIPFPSSSTYTYAQPTTLDLMFYYCYYYYYVFVHIYPSDEDVFDIVIIFMSFEFLCFFRLSTYFCNISCFCFLRFKNHKVRKKNSC